MSRAARRIAQTALVLTLTLLASLGAPEAHTGGTTGFATVTIAGQTVRYVLTIGIETLSADGGTRVANEYEALPALVAQHLGVTADGGACVALPGSVQPPSPERPNLVVTVHYACPAAVRVLMLRDDTFEVLGRDHHTLANVEWPGGREQLVFEADRREGRVVLTHDEETSSADRRPAESNGVFAFFRLGVEHILTGFDHILFLLALILRGGSIGGILGIVTAFTLAHSVTLALAVLHIVVPPARLIEPLIAISIAYVALENIFARRRPSRRWMVSFLFGLVHGFGFAGALLELGLPRQSLVASLFLFNLGVEAGQALVVALLVPALFWLCRFAWERQAVTTLSAVVFVAAVALLIDRTVFPIG